MTARHLQTEPIGDDDTTIEHALATAEVLPLVASVVHLTGDPSVVRGATRPRRFTLDDLTGGLDDDEQERLRALALATVLAHRDAGSPSSPPMRDDLTREVMDWLAGAPVDDDYAALFREELDLAGDDPRRIDVPSPESLSVIVVGCGMSGLLAAVRLRQAGIPFVVIEKNEGVGGTWFENTYPGCRVDVADHYYCYSFEPYDFSEHFARQPELHEYFRAVMKRHRVDEHVRWGTEVERATWDDDAKQWRVVVRDGAGRREELTATALISAVGQLNRPYVPELPGLDEFAGPVFHSARWRHDVDLRGRRVALVGAGASGFQIGPAIADDAEGVVVFQRSAQWIMPNRRYHAPVEAGTRWAMRHVPAYERWYRFLLLRQATDTTLPLTRVDPDWPGRPLSANAASERFRQRLVAWMEQQLADAPQLLADVVPDYPPFGKRILQDDGTWLRFLARPDVELVRTPIEAIEPHTVVAGGVRHEVDVVVLATGFRANEFLAPMEIRGRDGVALHDVWQGRPSAYLGITVPGFPNLFLMYGPGTNLAHAGSVIFQSECQLRYIGGCLERLAECGGGAIEPTQDAFDEYVARWQRELSATVWADPSVRHSWYKAADGNVYVLSPWRLVDYWDMTRAPDPAAHRVVARSTGA